MARRAAPIFCRMKLLRTGILATFLFLAGAVGAAAPSLEQSWANPPREARLRAYWWWLNGNVTKTAITRDLEEMKAKGFGGALICDADGASQDGNAKVPHGPTFFTPEWRELYRHTLREAARLGLEMSLNIQSGWNLGGPIVTAGDAAKKLVWTETRTSGPAAFAQKLAEPAHKDPYYRDLFVVAFRPSGIKPRPIQNQAEKAMVKTLHFSAPDTTPLLIDVPAEPGEEEARTADVIDLTGKLDANGTLQWQVPAGQWVIERFGCTVGDRSRVSTSSEGWQGYALDVLDAGAFKRYWDAIVEPLIDDAGPLAGSTLKYLHTDSWEVEAINWTPTLRDEFRQRRGYDLRPWLPVIAGHIVNSRAESNRFLHDFRKTLGDLAIDHHFKPFAAWAHRRGLQIHPESGGPHAVPIDAQRCLGMDDMPMSEFWAESWRHRVGDPNRFFVKQPASAAHTYGHRFVAAEGFTTIGPHWQETLWDNLKPSFDKACTEGLNLLVWHAFVCSPAEMGVPGQQYFAGTHLNPNVTWWSRSAPFFAYINRCQAMLQRGVPVADVLYYYGDHVPNFAQLRASDPAKLGAGYDYDVVTEDALLTRCSAKAGSLALPDGPSYNVLVLPNHTAMSLPVLRKLREFVRSGVTVVGPKPREATGLAGFPESDRAVAELASALWDEGAPRHVIAGKSAREVLAARGHPDFEYQGGTAQAEVSYIHRRDADAEIYFVASRGQQAESLRCAFRVRGKVPELWNAVTGEHRLADAYEEQDGRTVLPLEFAPCGSVFVVFREPAAKHRPTRPTNAPAFAERQTLGGPWQVTFDPKWAGPASATFTRLVSWPAREEPGIRFYSGTATYRCTFDLANFSTGGKQRLFLDLGRLRELAEVRLNGKPLGITWAPPFRVEITGAARAAGNVLEVDVVNFWPNRIIGDAALPVEQRLTKTNIQKLIATTPLIESGLLGPVRIVELRP